MKATTGLGWCLAVVLASMASHASAQSSVSVVRVVATPVQVGLTSANVVLPIGVRPPQNPPRRPPQTPPSRR